MTTTRIKAEPFPDLADAALYPRFSEHGLEWLAERGERRPCEAGDVLHEHEGRGTAFCA